MEAKFTPGPWKTDGRAVCGNGTGFDIDGYCVAVADHRGTAGRFAMHITPDIADANAKLIAQAPTLAALLVKMTARIKGTHCLGYCSGAQSGCTTCRDIELARDTLKLAGIAAPELEVHQ